jgi:predicted short-subunit dehydrogenase-like oxidoreductase (DUF2520 family)
VILAVPDDALTSVAEALASSGDWEGRVVLHTSGFHGREILSPLAAQGAHTGTLHPLQAVPGVEEGIRRIPGSAFAVDGDPEALRAAHQLAKAAGGNPIEIPEESRPLYHASAVLASNALVALLDAALETLIAAGVSGEEARRALLPLVRGTLDNLEGLPSVSALTGPVARGDVGTVKGHLEALKRLPRPGSRMEPGVRDIYALLSRRALGIAARGAPLTNEHLKIAKLLLEILPK